MKKNLITSLKSALVTLGIGSEENYNNKNLVKNLKELAVVAGAADSTEDINSNSAVEVLDYIAENGESIVTPAPSGTKNITANGTYDVTEYAQANVNAATPKFIELTIKNNSGVSVNVENSLFVVRGYVVNDNTISIQAGASKTASVVGEDRMGDGTYVPSYLLVVRATNSTQLAFSGGTITFSAPYMSSDTRYYVKVNKQTLTITNAT